MKIYLDPGHGGTDPGAVGHGLMEKDVVLDLAWRMKRMLQAYPAASVKLSRTDDATKSLSARTNEANKWGADIFLSLHCNASNGRARGYEDFIYTHLPTNADTRNYQTILHEKVAVVIGLPNRGKKQANFHVLRESKMPAILTENGFIDHPEDARLMKQSVWREKVAAAHVSGLVEIFKLPKLHGNKGRYTVIAGSFLQLDNAEKMKLSLFKHDIPATINPVMINGKNLFRVHAGKFPNRKAAEIQLQRLATMGIRAFVQNID